MANLLDPFDQYTTQRLYAMGVDPAEICAALAYLGLSRVDIEELCAFSSAQEIASAVRQAHQLAFNLNNFKGNDDNVN